MVQVLVFCYFSYFSCCWFYCFILVFFFFFFFFGGGDFNLQAGSDYAYRTRWSPRLVRVLRARVTLLFSHVETQA